MEQPVSFNNAPNLARGEVPVSAQSGHQNNPANYKEVPRNAPPEAGTHEQYIQPQTGSGGNQTFVPSTSPPPPQVQPVNQTQDDSVQTDDKQLIADDVDVIEKEWVDKAKQIVAATHDDPRTQEQKVSQLQSDYLKTRYGKEIGVSDE